MGEIITGSFFGTLIGLVFVEFLKRYLEKRDLNAPRIRKGNLLLCPDPSCGEQIARSKKNLYGSQILNPNSYEILSGEITAETSLACPRCETMYYVNGRIHTNKGWR